MPDDMTFNKNQLVDYLSGTLNVDIAQVNEDTLLFSSGLIDSFSMIDLITFIETQCGIRVSPTDITLDNFDTIGRIMNFVQNGHGNPERGPR